MEALLYGIVFILGTIVGSFLNVLSLRFHTGRPIVYGRSACSTCGRALSPRELVPLVSFLVQRGRCRACHAKISWQYPLVELLAGILFVALWWRFGVSMTGMALVTFVYTAVIVSLTIAISIYDMLHKIIPNAFVYTLTGVSAISLFVDFGTSAIHAPALWHVLAGPLLWLPLALLWLVSRGRWIGLGDAKLVWAFGWVLGLSGGVSAVVFGFWLGALWGIGALLGNRIGLAYQSRALTMKSELPLGPFLICGFLTVLLTGLDITAFIF